MCAAQIVINDARQRRPNRAGFSTAVEFAELSRHWNLSELSFEALLRHDMHSERERERSRAVAVVVVVALRCCLFALIIDATRRI